MSESTKSDCIGKFEAIGGKQSTGRVTAKLENRKLKFITVILIFFALTPALWQGMHSLETRYRPILVEPMAYLCVTASE